MKSAVHNAADREFEKCYYPTSCETSEYKTAVFHSDVYKMNQQKSKPPGQDHRPVCVTSCHDFNESVNYSAEAENSKVLSESDFCQNNHLYYIVPKNQGTCKNASSFFCYLSFGSIQ